MDEFPNGHPIAGAVEFVFLGCVDEVGVTLLEGEGGVF